MIITTKRLQLRAWEDQDRIAFAEMHADPEVMQDYGGPLTRSRSDIKFERYLRTQHEYGFARQAVYTRDGIFLGYSGIMPSPAGHPLGHHIEIGWRLIRSSWGNGYATESTKAIINDAFSRLGLSEVLAYTSSDNVRSIGVMERLQMKREENRDFVADYDGFAGWQGLVWVARRIA